jgi:hypothetical protein
VDYFTELFLRDYCFPIITRSTKLRYQVKNELFCEDLLPSSVTITIEIVKIKDNRFMMEYKSNIRTFVFTYDSDNPLEIIQRLVYSLK